ncbi:hypothetical protein MORTIMER_130 [Erwinia phage vB_EamM_Mortimer]|uniref:Uncharacterized protein n=1 Tax=Erwinia phage vB_EamM_Mortimer TaxID=2060129 RepID=A0A2H5BKM4_9CAUD|nr:hypothetical protein MORTIMER_130 [Erwinia phage vB_EamM_Mortimer]
MKDSEHQDTTIDNVSPYAGELADLIEEFVADRFTLMDDAVLESLYADLPDVTYLKGVVKGLRRNLMRQAASINVEDAYPKVMLFKEQPLTAEDIKEIIQADCPDMPADEVTQTVTEVMTATDEDDDDDNSEALRLRESNKLEHIPSLDELMQADGKGWGSVSAVITPPPVIEPARPARPSRAERFGTSNVELAELLSQAKPGSVFSVDTIKSAKDKNLVLVKSPETKHFEPLRLLERSDPQYYQYMWPALFEALEAVLNDTSLTVNRMRRLDEEMLARFGDTLAAAVTTILSIGNHDLLIKENVNYFMQQCNDRGLDIKLYMGAKVYKQGRWINTWIDAALQTPKGKFIFGTPEVDVVWQAK